MKILRRSSAFVIMMTLVCGVLSNANAAGVNVIAWGEDVAGQSAMLPRLTNVVALGVGLALKSDGTLLAWGNNFNGQTNIPPGLTNIAAISAATDFNVVLRSNGTVVAWGNMSVAVTNVPAGLSNVVAISAADATTLALRKDGTVVAWGNDNQWGELNVPSWLNDAVAVHSGGDHGFALRSNGTVVGWGANYNQQMGIPASLTNAVAIDDCMALKADGTVVVWGNGQFTPTNVPPGLSNVQAIAVGPYFAMALKTDGTVVAWGNDTFGDTEVPAGLSHVTAIAAGGNYQALAVNDGTPAFSTQPTNLTVYSGTTATFNFRAGGASPLTYSLQFNGVTVAQSTDSPPSLNNVQPAQAGLYSVMLSNAFGSVTSSNVTLTVSNSAPIITQQPAAQSVLPGWNPVLSVGTSGSLPSTYQWRFNGTNIAGATASSLTLANVQFNKAGTYSVAVSNAFGSALSTGAALTVAPSFVLEWQNGSLSPPSGVTNVVSIAAGSAFGLGIRTDGTIVAWGDNSYGQTSVPVVHTNGQNLPVITNAIEVAAGAEHSLALQADHTVMAWGAGTVSINSSPYWGQAIVPAGLTNVIAIAAGGYLSLALKGDGTVVAWGNNAYGQTNVPASLSNVVAIATTGLDGIALRGDGTVAVWGSTNLGIASVPAGLSNVVAIAGGEMYVLALKSDGTVVGWGQNGNGGPVAVPSSLGNVTGIAGSAVVSLALGSNGNVSAWGNLNTVDTPFEPAALWPAASNVVAVAAGGNISMGLVSSFPQRVGFQQSSFGQGGFAVSLPTSSGRVYQLQFKNSLADLNWTSLPLVAGNGAVQMLTDPTTAATQRFYRVLRW